MDIGSVHGSLRNEAPQKDADQIRRAELDARKHLADVTAEAYRTSRPDDVRHDKVIRAQARIEQAFYNRDDIRQALVDRLAASDELEAEIDDDEPASRRLDEIKQQIRRGDYLNNDIVTGLADRLADSLSDGLE